MDRKGVILIIDDEKDIVKVLKKRLSDAGYEVVSAKDGFAGLAKAKEFLPDLILLDVMMPGLDGLQVKVKLSEDETAPDVPVIFLTAKGKVPDKVAGLRLGADDYVTKPFDFEELLARIESVIGRRKYYAEIALTDPLTGLSSPRAFKKQLQIFFNLARRNKRLFSLIVIDVDGFKKINDTYGHKTGDEVLKMVAQCLRQVFREADILVRYGGDEFVILLPEATETQTQIVMDRLRGKMRGAKVVLKKNTQEIPFSVSMGSAVYSDDLPDEGRLFEMADQRMYQDKRSKQGVKKEKKVVLLIEDEEGIRKTVSFRLKQAGFDTVVAEKAKKGLEEARRLKPDLIILDLMLPDLPGEEICKAIREDENDERFAKTPIIMLTAKSGDVDRIVGKVIGANCYMTKPFQIEELIANIQKFSSVRKSDVATSF